MCGQGVAASPSLIASDRLPLLTFAFVPIRVPRRCRAAFALLFRRRSATGDAKQNLEHLLGIQVRYARLSGRSLTFVGSPSLPARAAGLGVLVLGSL